MAKMNVKTGDTVVVITGKDAGKIGKVLSVSPKTNRVVVEGVNIVSKAHKARSAQDKSEFKKVQALFEKMSNTLDDSASTIRSSISNETGDINKIASHVEYKEAVKATHLILLI